MSLLFCNCVIFYNMLRHAVDFVHIGENPYLVHRLQDIYENNYTTKWEKVNIVRDRKWPYINQVPFYQKNQVPFILTIMPFVMGRWVKFRGSHLKISHSLYCNSEN